MRSALQARGDAHPMTWELPAAAVATWLAGSEVAVTMDAYLSGAVDVHAPIG